MEWNNSNNLHFSLNSPALVNVQREKRFLCNSFILFNSTASLVVPSPKSIDVCYLYSFSFDLKLVLSTFSKKSTKLLSEKVVQRMKERGSFAFPAKGEKKIGNSTFLTISGTF